jgi:predicted PurR-regulated permease PerM
VTIEGLRDLIICIYGIIGIFVLIFISVIVMMLYKKIQNLMNTVKSTTENVNHIVDTVKAEFVRPVLQITTIFHGIKQIASLVNSIFKKSGEEQHGQ